MPSRYRLVALTSPWDLFTHARDLFVWAKLMQPGRAVGMITTSSACARAAMWNHQRFRRPKCWEARRRSKSDAPSFPEGRSQLLGRLHCVWLICWYLSPVR